MSISPQALEEIYAEYSPRIEQADPSNLVTIVETEFTQYKNAVTTFFTDKADEIRSIYKSIRENAMPYNKISSADSNKARHIYMEYYDGLKEYLTKLLDIKGTDEVDSNVLAGGITKVKTRDHEFIDSIYGAEKNPPEEMDLNSAMMNIEVLIDLYNNADFMIGDLKKFVSMHANAEATYAEQMASGLKLLAHSIRHFHKDMIKEILECYDKIHNSIQNRTPVGGEKIVEKYQLF